MGEFINLFSPNKVIIEGHTDSDGNAEANRYLSERRAEAVRQILLNTYDFITPGMIEARGYGEERPIVENDTPANKEINRRVEVIIWN